MFNLKKNREQIGNLTVNVPDYRKLIMSKYPFLKGAMCILTLSYITSLVLINFMKCIDFYVISRSSPYKVTLLKSNVIELTKCICQVLTF